MKYRHLPGTELDLPEVGFGVWTVSTDWWGRMEEIDRVTLLQKAFDLGVTFFDTADTHGKGYGEEILFKALRTQRHEIVIGTKFGYDFYNYLERLGHEEREQRFDREFIRFACEQSLRRLGTDYIDLYQLHNPKIDVIEQDEVFSTLEDLVREGKVRYYGVALGPGIGWVQEGTASMCHREIKSLEIIYNILEQDAARCLFPIAKDKKIGLISRVPHASDVLTSKYRRAPESDGPINATHLGNENVAGGREKAAMVKFLSQGTGRTVAQAAIKFCLSQECLVSVLPNITTSEELLEYLEAPDCPDISDEEQQRLDELWQEGFYLSGASMSPDKEP